MHQDEVLARYASLSPAPLDDLFPPFYHHFSTLDIVFQTDLLAEMETLPSVVRYARHYGICYDYRNESPLYKLQEVDLVDDDKTLPELPDFVPPTAEPPKDSKLRLSQHASKLLISATTPPPAPHWSTLLLDNQKPQLQKLELPLLLTDHKKDFQKFLLRRGLEPEDISFPVEILNEENDEGLSWPSPIRKLCTQWDSDIAHEKLQISRESLHLLECAMRDTWEDDDHKRFVMDLLKSKKTPTLEPISPPLMAEDLSFKPRPSSPPRLEVALTSDPISLTSLPEESPPQSPLHQNYLQRSQEVPLDIKLPDYYPTYFKYEDDDLIDYDAGEPSSSTVSEEHKEKDARTVMHKTGNDFVSARSLISHVVVPNLAPYTSGSRYLLPSLPDADGIAQLFGDERFQKTSGLISRVHRVEPSPSKSVSFSVELETAIPHGLHGVRIPSDPKLHQEIFAVVEYKPPMQNEVTGSHQMLWKPDKPSLLNEDEYEEEDLEFCFSTDDYKSVNEGVCEIKHETSLHIKEDPFEEALHQDLTKAEQSDRRPVTQVMDQRTVSKKRKPLDEIVNDAKRQFGISTAQSSSLFGLGSLSSFLGTRNEKTKSDIEAGDSSEAHVGSHEPGTSNSSSNTEDPEPVRIAALESLRTIFFSAGQIQAQHSLLRFFEAWAGDTLKIVYRDLKFPILLNPNHAVTITTLQALTQRPLPGHDRQGFSAIQNHISVIAQCHSLENLTVLVTTSAVGTYDPNITLSFTAYCDTISYSSECQIEPIYVPPGEASLQSAIAKLILEYAIHTNDMSFHEEETIWEKILVSAGMNPFAAQLFLGTLKGDGGGEANSLRAFVQMDPAERKERFGGIVVSSVLDHVASQIKNSANVRI